MGGKYLNRKSKRNTRPGRPGALLRLTICVLVMAGSVLLPNRAEADIFQWAWVDPTAPSAGKYESGTLVPGGAEVSAVQGANLRQRDLTQAYLIGADLRNADLRSARLNLADLTGANLNEATLVGANLSGAILSGASIRGADFMNLTGTISRRDQIYSTASYQNHDLRGLGLRHSSLAGWNFAAQNLAGASFAEATLTNADFSNADLTGASFAGAMLTGATLTGATIRNADFSNLGWTTFAPSQLYSTASYVEKDLRGINFSNFSLGWNLSGQNMSGARFGGTSFGGATLDDANLSGSELGASYFNGTSLKNANLSGANLFAARFSNDVDLTGAIFEDANVGSFSFFGQNGFTSAQLYSTASYKQRNLQNIELDQMNLSGWNFSDQDLSGSGFQSNLAGADFADAIVTDVKFYSPIAPQQLYQTANYKSGNLYGVLLSGDLAGFDLSRLDLKRVSFWRAKLGTANLTDSLINYADFSNTPTNGFSQQKLMSTASHKLGNLEGVGIGLSTLDGWKLSNLNLSSASFAQSNIQNSDFSKSNLRSADFHDVTISNGNFKGISAAGVKFTYSQLTDVDLSSSGLFKASFIYSRLIRTQFRDAGVSSASFDYAILEHVDFTGADLRNSNFSSATLTSVLFRDADLRGVTGLSTISAANAILPDGIIAGLHLDHGEELRIRGEDFGLPVVPAAVIIIGPPPPPPTPVTVNGGFTMTPDSTLTFLLGSPASSRWAQTVAFEPGVPVELAGALMLAIQPGVDPGTMVSKSFNIFDWTGVSPVGRFSVEADAGFVWDTSWLYTSGIVTLVSVPEPAGVVVVLIAAAAILTGRNRSRCLHESRLRTVPAEPFPATSR